MKLKLEYAPSDSKRAPLYGETKSELAEEFRPYVCYDCLADAGLFNHHGSLEELLGTPCGCEWWLTDEDGNVVYLDEWP